MSLYNLLHGENQSADLLLGLLGITREDVPRYRDCWFDGKRIVIHTRTGGGNRDFYEHPDVCRENFPEYFEDGKDHPSGPWNCDLRKLPTFQFDTDDDGDSTYANFSFDIPESMAWVIPLLSVEGRTAADKWNEVFRRMNEPDALTDPQIKRASDALRPMFEKIAEHLKEPK